MAAVWSAGAVAGYADAVPNVFTYQGKLSDVEGRPFPDDRYRMSFALFPSETGGTAFYSQESMVVTSGGVFTAPIGPVTAAALNLAAAWLEVRLAGEEPLPRQRVTAVPYAIRAGDLALPFSGTVTYSNPAFSVDQRGAGSAGSFTIHNAASAGHGLYAYTNGTGNALYAHSPGTGDTARFEKSIGTGNAASFYSYGFTNPGSAIRAYGNSQGPVIKATTDYTSAPAGFFKVESTASTQVALYAETLGTGSGVYAYTGGASTAVSAVSSGSGPAIKASASYGGLAFTATSSGMGGVAALTSTNTVTSEPVMNLENAAGGMNNTLRVAQNGPSSSAIVAIASGDARAGEFIAESYGASYGTPTLSALSLRPGGPAFVATNAATSNQIAARFNGKVEMQNDASVAGSLTQGPNNVGMPIGYAHFSSGGSRLRGTANLTCTALADPYYGSYLVDIADETYIEGSHIVLVTPVTTSGTTIAHVWPFSGDIRIAMSYLSNGAATRCGFSILIY